MVEEPRVPPICRTLDARIGGPDGSVSAPDESARDTDRIQAAIDGCETGHAVQLRAGQHHAAFLTGPLHLRREVTLLVAERALLVGSRDPRDYDVRPGSCGIVDDRGNGCRPLIQVSAPNAAIMGEGAIDGRGGATLVGRRESWWDLAQDAKVRKLQQNVPRLIVATRADNFVLYRITLRNSPNFHVVVSRTNGFTAWGVTVDAPRTARNTDGIDPSSSTNVTIAHSFIRVGDDNVAIKAGGNGPATHMTIAHNHFYSGHGMSIGSETNGGVSAIDVSDLTIDGADNGLRIKSNPSRGGLVEGVSYRDVCIRNVKHPIVMDTTYDGVVSGALVPEYRRITLDNVRIEGGGKLAPFGAPGREAPPSIGIVMRGVEVDAKPFASCDGRFVPFPESRQDRR